MEAQRKIYTYVPDKYKNWWTFRAYLYGKDTHSTYLINLITKLIDHNNHGSARTIKTN